MKKLLLSVLIFTILFLSFSTSSNASHLMGGSLTYQYLGLDSISGLYNYRITITIYRYCEPGSSLLPTSLDLGVYQDNPANPSGDKLLVQDGVVPLLTIQSITPPNANDSCTFAPNVCVEEGVYQSIVSVPANTTGYYFISDRCCRNNNIINLNNAGNTGQAYFAYAPATGIVNSSPTFAAAPVPFICSSDTITILNQAYDIDGDLLIYNFVVPYSGISSNFNPNPNPPNNYTWPIPLVNYSPGYSLANTFGAGGAASINTSTGLASYFAPNQGFYVLAVEIQEFRNGVLIGVTRRDLQIIVIPCPINPAPVLSSGLQTTYTIDEGQTLCFTTTFTDSNGDSLYITHTGDIFNPVITNPAATFTDGSGAATATGDFCWTTDCSQGRTTPYQFSVNAADNGCPAKITNIVFTINVTNTEAPAAITGPDTLCLNDANGISYTVPNAAGFTHSWFIANGTINGSSTGTTISATFTSPGQAIIGATTINANGCISDTTYKTVQILPVPAAIAGPDIQFCSGGSATMGVGPTGGYTYSWSPATGLSNPSVSNPTVTLTNTGTTNITTTYILTTTLSGCTNSDTVVVTTVPNPVAIAGPDVSFCSGESVTIGSSSVAGVTYIWTPATGLSNSTIGNPSVTLINGTSSPVSYWYTVQVQNSFGCSTLDSVNVTVNPVPVALAGNDIVFCNGSSGQIGAPATGGYSYSWSPATGLSNATASNPNVTLINSTTVSDTVVYILTTAIGACSDQDTVQVIIQPSPVSNAGTNQLYCGSGTLQLGTSTTPGYTYSWSPSSGLSDTTISDPVLIINNSGSTSDTLIYVVTTTLNGCTTTDTVQIISSPLAIANAGTDITFCSGNTGVIGSNPVSGYVYSWSPSTGLSNGTIGNPSVTLINTSGVNDTIFYIVTTNLFGCLDQDTVQVIVRPNPVSEAGANQLLCAGNTLQLGTAGTPGYTYIWTPSNGLNNTTISNPSLTLNNTGTTPDTLIYIVTTTLNGCTTSDSVQIISGPAPVAIAGPDASICSGQTVTIGATGTPGYNYSWSPSLGLSNNLIASPTVSLINGTNVADTVTYILSVNAYGCIDSDTISIIVLPLPVSEAGTSSVICGGDTFVLGTAPTSGYTYSWTPATGLSSTTISNPVGTFNNNGTTPVSTTYTVTTTLNGCTTADSITVTVNPQPVVTATATPIAICLGNSATLNGNGAVNFSWALLTAPQTSIGTGTPFTVSPTVTTAYILTGTNSFSCSNLDTVTVVVNPLPVVQIAAPTQTICDGDTLTLTATGASNYTWSVSGGSTIGSGSSIQVYPTVTTTYIVSGTDGNSCSDTDSITVTVNPAATLSGAAGTLSVCPGVTGVPYWIINPNSTSTYTWTLTNGTVVTGQGGDTITVDWSSVSGTGIVSVVENTALGCQSEPVILQVSINVILTPVAPTGPTVFCANTAQGITYTALNTPGSTYNWIAQGGIVVSGDGTSTILVDWTTAGPATVYLYYNESSTTSTNVCFGTSDTLEITLNPVPVTSAISGPVAICVSDTGSFSVVSSAGSTYAWTVNGGSVLTGNGTNSVTANWSGSGTATINVQETNSFGCIGNVVSIPVVVNALPAANAGTDTGVCIGQGVQLNASGGVAYSWTPSTGLNNVSVSNPVASPVTSTTYIVLVTDNNGCKNTDTVFVAVNALPVITLTPNSAICIGGSLQLNAGGGTGYSWSPVTALSDPGISSPVANPVTTTTYTVVVTNSDGCVDSSDVTITVNPLPVAVTSADTLICDGTSTTLIAGGGISYSWSPSGSLNNAAVFNPVASPSSNTTYTVTVTDINGCTDDEDVTVSINARPIASFTIDATVLSASCNGAEVTLINTSIDALDYSWLFPDGTTSTDVNPVHAFSINSDNFITLTAINNICFDDTTVNYNSIFASNILKNMPNVFTPNNDGKNDCYDFGDLINFQECSKVTIYDRWGEVIYTNGSGRDCWNGRKNNTGDEFPSGTYFMTIVIAGEKLKSTITLLK